MVDIDPVPDFVGDAARKMPVDSLSNLALLMLAVPLRPLSEELTFLANQGIEDVMHVFSEQMVDKSPLRRRRRRRTLSAADRADHENVVDFEFEVDNLEACRRDANGLCKPSLPRFSIVDKYEGPYGSLVQHNPLILDKQGLESTNVDDTECVRFTRFSFSVIATIVESSCAWMQSQAENRPEMKGAVSFRCDSLLWGFRTGIASMDYLLKGAEVHNEQV